MNKAILMGRLTADPEYNTFGDKVRTRFTLAIDRRYAAQGGQKMTDFINCVAWSHNAETIAKYVAKGQRLIVEGSIQTDSYKTQDGSSRARTEVLVDRFEFCDSKKNTGDAVKAAKDLGFKEIQVYDDDDLPFA